jgi:hypothetical protein
MFVTFPKRSDRVWSSNQPLFSGYSGSFPGLKRLGLHVDHLPPGSVEVKNESSYIFTPPSCYHDVDKDKFSFCRKSNQMVEKFFAA